MITSTNNTASTARRLRWTPQGLSTPRKSQTSVRSTTNSTRHCRTARHFLPQKWRSPPGHCFVSEKTPHHNNYGTRKVSGEITSKTEERLMCFAASQPLPLVAFTTWSKLPVGHPRSLSLECFRVRPSMRPKQCRTVPVAAAAAAATWRSLEAPTWQ